jgi:hypothetical protein
LYYKGRSSLCRFRPPQSVHPNYICDFANHKLSSSYRQSSWNTSGETGRSDSCRDNLWRREFQNLSASNIRVCLSLISLIGIQFQCAWSTMKLDFRMITGWSGIQMKCN